MTKKLVLIGLLVDVTIAGWLRVSGLKECAWLDRLFGRSDCIGSITIAASGMPRGGTMTVPDEHGVSSLFGDAETVDGWRPFMIRIDPLTGQEFGRFPLRLQNGLDAMQPAADGKSTVLYCALRQRCIQGGHNALIVSLADVSELRPMDYDRYNSGPAFPGDPTPGEKFHIGAVFGDGGRTVISLDHKKIWRIYRSNGERIAVLSQPQDRYNPRAASLLISPSGRYVMLWDAYGGSKGDRFVIWDARDGRHIQTLTAAGDYRVMSKPAWMRGDNGIFVLTRRGGKPTIDSFVLQTETEDKI